MYVFAINSYVCNTFCRTAMHARFGFFCFTIIKIILFSSCLFFIILNFLSRQLQLGWAITQHHTWVSTYSQWLHRLWIRLLLMNGIVCIFIGGRKYGHSQEDGGWCVIKLKYFVINFTYIVVYLETFCYDAYQYMELSPFHLYICTYTLLIS